MWYLISMRTMISHHGDVRDVIEQNYINYFESLKINLIPVSNKTTNLNKYFDLPIKGIILSGGNDIGEKWSGLSSTSSVDEHRDEFEISLIKFGIKNNMPILGICRGIQMINCFFGGKLEINNKSLHSIGEHIVNITNTKQGNNTEVLVNSYHNQIISQNTLSKSLRSFAKNPVDNSIEGLYHPKLPIAGIQWHPERGNSKSVNKEIIEEFVMEKGFWKNKQHTG